MSSNPPAAEGLARAWVMALRARGVTLKIRNGRLWLLPARAYKELTDEERATLRHHRDEIKAVVASGVVDAVPVPPPPPPPPQLPRDQWAAVGVVLGRNGCPTHALGDEHARKILTGEIQYDVALRDERATREMHLLVMQHRRPFTL